ncbi:hypothetical protein C8F04DRAFT_1196396 [Mycena alexandri]|uniref:Uncharacterized protein n=1 Tax=Mycena alexandri TaxID=1745969 RepID=A0AAD6WPQ1_9AGAR|nr:hypothetical protein C8F04DRAFT_1196396 [Mycena alexandri]
MQVSRKKIKSIIRGRESAPSTRRWEVRWRSGRQRQSEESEAVRDVDDEEGKDGREYIAPLSHHSISKDTRTWEPSTHHARTCDVSALSPCKSSSPTPGVGTQSGIHSTIFADARTISSSQTNPKPAPPEDEANACSVRIRNPRDSKETAPYKHYTDGADEGDETATKTQGMMDDHRLCVSSPASWGTILWFQRVASVRQRMRRRRSTEIPVCAGSLPTPFPLRKRHEDKKGERDVRFKF